MMALRKRIEEADEKTAYDIHDERCVGKSVMNVPGQPDARCVAEGRPDSAAQTNDEEKLHHSSLFIFPKLYFLVDDGIFFQQVFVRFKERLKFCLFIH